MKARKYLQIWFLTLDINRAILLRFVLDLLWSGWGLSRCAVGLGYFDVEQPPELLPRDNLCRQDGLGRTYARRVRGG